MTDTAFALDEVAIAETARFWAKVATCPSNATQNTCWEWTGSKSAKGYGFARKGRRQASAHRLSWEMHFGAVPEGLFVCHRCDNPSCVRPSHLFLGTAAENNRDRDEKGRGARLRGERHGKSKISDAKAIEIALAVAGGESVSYAARRFKVTKQIATRAVKTARELGVAV